MEHFDLEKTLRDAGLAPGDDAIRKMKLFARMVVDYNSLVNLTGARSIEEAEKVLVAQSILPFSGYNVPRGTLLLDMGTGSGVPGVPLALVFEGISTILVDSNGKRTTFVESVIEELGIEDCRVVTARAEELGREQEYREKADILVSRGFAHPYVAMEMGAPLVKTGGMLFVYAPGTEKTLPAGMHAHAADLGLVPGYEAMNRDTLGEGYVFVKKEATSDRFPRRYPAIKRAADKIQL